ncbi:hypothetical protein ACCS93_36055 [Rhizobium ruizarguesonis]
MADTLAKTTSLTKDLVSVLAPLGSSQFARQSPKTSRKSEEQRMSSILATSRDLRASAEKDGKALLDEALASLDPGNGMNSFARSCSRAEPNSDSLFGQEAQNPELIVKEAPAPEDQPAAPQENREMRESGHVGETLERHSEEEEPSGKKRAAKETPNMAAPH